MKNKPFQKAGMEEGTEVRRDKALTGPDNLSVERAGGSSRGIKPGEAARGTGLALR